MTNSILRYIFATIILSHFFFFSCEQKESKPFPENAEAVKVADGFSFTEGPSADSAGNIYFTDQPNNIIYRYTTEGVLDTFSTASGRANGLYIDSKQNLWACADLNNQLWKFSLDGNKEIVLNREGKAEFNGPNDVWVHQNGNVYFTDPYYKRHYWEEPHDTLAYQGVYLLVKGYEKAILIDSTLVQPNGIVGDSENDLLFVADIGANKTYSYKLDKEGGIIKKKLLINQGSDGLTVDNQRNVYLTGKGVDVFDSTGVKIRHLDIPEEWTANICFGGKENNELFITATHGLYTLKTNVKGIK